MTTKTFVLGKSTNSNAVCTCFCHFLQSDLPPFQAFLCLFLHKTLMPQEQVVIQAMLIRKTRMRATATKGQIS